MKLTVRMRSALDTIARGGRKEPRPEVGIVATMEEFRLPGEAAEGERRVWDLVVERAPIDRVAPVWARTVERVAVGPADFGDVLLMADGSVIGRILQPYDGFLRWELFSPEDVASPARDRRRRSSA